MGKKQIVILGGGFGGIYTAMHLEKLYKKNPDVEISLVNRENYFVYQPMLAEVVGGSIGILDTVSSIRKLLPKTLLYIREIDAINLEGKKIILAPQFSHKPLELSYDYLVLSLGNVTDFRGMTGLHEHALPFKNLADAIAIRNRVIDAIEAASIEKDQDLKKELLTFVVGGGGFSGTEVVAEINDFARSLAKKYPSIDRKELRVVLIHSKERLMDRELSESLGNYAGRLLEKRGVEIHFNEHLVSATPQEAFLESGLSIGTKTIISTVPSSPNPLIESLKLPSEKGRIKTDLTFQVEGSNHIWALGDCALIPHPSGKGFCPPTAQFALRQGKVLAENIQARIKDKPSKDFGFKGLGMMGALGHHSAVAELFGKIKFSGFLAWFLWRAIYWIKLPGLDRKIKVALSWMLDTLFPPEAVQLKIAPSQGIVPLHFEKDEIIFHEGDIGDYLYILVNGEVDILKRKGDGQEKLASLQKGEYFGEMALLNQRSRTATVKCTSPVDVLALKKNDFGLLVANFQELRNQIHETEQTRARKLN
ncbi:MAG: FAD-dependent oxidoreductase [Simkaniaceae bacterium]